MSDLISFFRSVGKALLLLGLTVGTAVPEDRVLFDFEEPGCDKAWSNIDIYALRQAEAKAEAEARAKAGQPTARLPAALPAEPPVKIESQRTRRHQRPACPEAHVCPRPLPHGVGQVAP